MDYQMIPYFLQNIVEDYSIWYKSSHGFSYMGEIWKKQILSARNNLLSLLNTLKGSLKNWLLMRILAEALKTLNSRSVTVETLVGVKSEQLFWLRNIFTMRSKLLLPPPAYSIKANELVEYGDVSDSLQMSSGLVGARNSYRILNLLWNGTR